MPAVLRSRCFLQRQLRQFCEIKVRFASYRLTKMSEIGWDELPGRGFPIGKACQKPLWVTLFGDPLAVGILDVKAGNTAAAGT